MASPGVCVNGAPAFVYAYSEPAERGSSDDWVIQLGAAPTLNFCIDEAHCAMFGVPPASPPKPGTNMTLTPGGRSGAGPPKHSNTYAHEKLRIQSCT